METLLSFSLDLLSSVHQFRGQTLGDTHGTKLRGFAYMGGGGEGACVTP